MKSILEEELIEAAKENNLPEASRILRAGADVNAKDSNGFTPQHWACFKGQVQVAKELLDHGADVDATDNHGSTPLHRACFNGNVQIVKELLDHGADTETTNRFGKTPLYFACNQGHLAVVNALLSGGANILAENINGALPIHYAVIMRKSAVAKYLLQHFYATTRRLPIHELLQDLTWKGDPSSIDAPPLRLALHRNVLGTDDIVEIVEYLVGQNPALLSSRDQDGSLPLHVACRRGVVFAIVQSVVDLYKASVKSMTPQGDLPLFLACELPATSLSTIFILMKLNPDVVYRSSQENRLNSDVVYRSSPENRSWSSCCCCS
jgi:ankyrin repeat protein